METRLFDTILADLKENFKSRKYDKYNRLKAIAEGIGGMTRGEQEKYLQEKYRTKYIYINPIFV